MEMRTSWRPKILVVASRLDKASMNIANKLMEMHDFQPTDLTFDGWPVYARGDVALAFTNVDDIFAEHVGQLGPEAVIFASRHASSKGEPTLSTHTPGNLGHEALYGGRPRELAWSEPNIMKKALQVLEAERSRIGLLDYKACLEATHHGPTGLQVPVAFVEIGSTPDRWSDPLAGEAVAEAIWEAATKPARADKAIGFGGGHYAPKFTKLVLEEVGIAVGHIVPKHVFSTLGQDRWLVEEPVSKTWGGCKVAVLDRKGLKGPDRKFVASVAEELGLEVLII